MFGEADCNEGELQKKDWWVKARYTKSKMFQAQSTGYTPDEEEIEIDLNEGSSCNMTG